jgi:hypothetical protein
MESRGVHNLTDAGADGAEGAQEAPVQVEQLCTAEDSGSNRGEYLS